jgi:hypothetical protein
VSLFAYIKRDSLTKLVNLSDSSGLRNRFLLIGDRIRELPPKQVHLRERLGVDSYEWNDFVAEILKTASSCIPEGNLILSVEAQELYIQERDLQILESLFHYEHEQVRQLHVSSSLLFQDNEGHLSRKTLSSVLKLGCCLHLMDEVIAKCKMPNGKSISQEIAEANTKFVSGKQVLIPLGSLCFNILKITKSMSIFRSLKRV